MGVMICLISLDYTAETDLRILTLNPSPLMPHYPNASHYLFNELSNPSHITFSNILAP